MRLFRRPSTSALGPFRPQGRMPSVEALDCDLHSRPARVHALHEMKTTPRIQTPLNNRTVLLRALGNASGTQRWSHALAE